MGDFLNGSEGIYGYPALRISRKVVRDALLEAAGEAGIEILDEKRCIGVLSEDEKVKAGFEEGSEIETGYLIGADGIHSQIRPFIAPTSVPEFSGMIGIGGTLMAEDLNYTIDDYGLDIPCMLLGLRDRSRLCQRTLRGRNWAFSVRFFRRSEIGWSGRNSKKTRGNEKNAEREV